MTHTPRCGDCAFWTPDGAHDGFCRHRAPCPTEVASQIANWPRTNERERCGDGALRDPETPAMVSCGRCRFWQPNAGGGLDPVNKHDKRRAWWETAGYCVRHAPAPSSDPGCRGFWQVTGINDACAEGQLS
jgi:hypothetical protein